MQEKQDNSLAPTVRKFPSLQRILIINVWLFFQFYYRAPSITVCAQQAAVLNVMQAAQVESNMQP